MKRTIFAAMGALTLISVLGIMLAFGLGGAATLTLLVLLLVSADLFIVGGMRESISIGTTELMWYHIVGCGMILVGLSFALVSVQETASSEIMYGAVIAGFISAGAVIFIGADFVRGGIHFDLSMVK